MSCGRLLCPAPSRAGLPPTALEWDLKLWWVHLEAMVATLMAAQHSASQQHFKLFQKVFDYTFDKVTSDCICNA